jgi:hypothetical protein
MLAVARALMGRLELLDNSKVKRSLPGRLKSDKNNAAKNGGIS